MNFKFFLLIFILILINFLSSYSNYYDSQIIKAISKDDIEFLTKEINEGLSVNYCIGYRNIPILKWSIESSAEKSNNFLLNRLLTLYGKDILLYALSDSKFRDIKIVKALIENGAFIPENIIDSAKELKVDKKIIGFLKRQINIKQIILKSESDFAHEIAELISQYAYDDEKTKDKACLIC